MFWLSGGAHLTSQLILSGLLCYLSIRFGPSSFRYATMSSTSLSVSTMKPPRDREPTGSSAVREVEPLIMRDGIAERPGAVVVEVGRGVLDPPERRDLELVRKEGARNGEWRGHRRMSGVQDERGCKRSPRSGDWTVTTGFTPSLMIHVRMGLLGALTMFTPRGRCGQRQ
jgi:hypothetical protein